MRRTSNGRSHRSHNSVKKSRRKSNNNLDIDLLDIKIIKELLTNPDIRSTTLAKKLAEPLSTIQRRKGDLEKSAILRRNYELSVQGLGWRNAEILMLVDRGEADKMAQELLEKFEKIIGTSVRINTEYNLAAYVTYRTSTELHELMESIMRMPNVKNLQWSEIVRELGNKNNRLAHLAFNSSLEQS